MASKQLQQIYLLAMFLFLMTGLLCFACGKVLRPTSCPCSNHTLCEPIRTKAEKEVVAFSGSGAYWKHYFWDNITAVIVREGFDPRIMCHAHSKGVRIVMMGTFSLDTLFNESARTAWIERTVESAIGNFTDGFNIDFEQPLDKSQAGVLTEMVKQIKDAFSKAMPYSQVTLDSPYTPDCRIFKRCYDYHAIGEIVDYIMIMAYDELDFDGRAMANAPFNKTIRGVEDFIQIGVPSSKLVLIVPWYGYDFPCSTIEEGDVCMYKNLSVKYQKGFGDIMKLLDKSTTGGKWSDSYESPYFDYKDIETGQTHQVWYDNATSLALRVQMAKEKQLRGVSVFHADCLDYSTHQKAVNETNEMWDAFIGEWLV
ncbi:di-N-acetylchitobiase-like [Lytechinus variegatus]|uniref:di-N-acetylchitobiase-like n=1 Tax=Lytechinus variegatus TaxID=7654 RepID=UPI001BB1F1DC|nr:di-N-acetylchitobiase-like [Lytechinus variegatus]